MKKVFLVFSVAAFYTASAQQKGMFDIDRHIQEVLKKKNVHDTRVKPSETDTVFIKGFTQSRLKPSHTLSNGDKVYLLSQDNMPCVVTDLTQFNMPDVSNPSDYYESWLFRNNTPGTIPNAVKPYRIIVSK